MTTTTKFFADQYVDSVVQLSGMRAMREVAGVDWASAAMATPANVDTLREQGVVEDDLAGRGANDFFLVVRAEDDEAAAAALAAGETAVFAARTAPDAREQALPRTLRAALERQPETNVAIVSVPGEYAALAGHQALAAGLHVLLFSDNVGLAQERALKEHARAQGLLLMGPGAGTAALSGVGLGFANVVGTGRVGVVAAAGTGAQEAMSLVDRWGAGVSQVIGLGGRDLTTDIGGLMARSAITTLRDDPATDVILFVSKPPDERVAHEVLDLAGDTPVVAALIGLPADFTAPEGVVLAATLEAGATGALTALGLTAPDPTRTEGPSLAQARERLAPGRRLVRGLFSGGTLCYESLVILGRLLGEVRSNTPVNHDWGLPAPAGSHQCLDLGEEEYTKGRPHPMIDAQARVELLREHGADPDVAAIILDVVLGHGSNPDPAGVLAPECAAVMADGGPQVVAYVLGTMGDPQGYEAQRATLVAAGCIVTETAARASLVAAALATGDLDLAKEQL